MNLNLKKLDDITAGEVIARDFLYRARRMSVEQIDMELLYMMDEQCALAMQGYVEQLEHNLSVLQSFLCCLSPVIYTGVRHG